MIEHSRKKIRDKADNHRGGRKHRRAGSEVKIETREAGRYKIKEEVHTITVST